MPANAAMVAVLEAAETGDVGTLTELLEGVSIDMRGEDGDTALHIGCLHGQLGVVEECLKRGADVNVSDEDGSIETRLQASRCAVPAGAGHPAVQAPLLGEEVGAEQRPRAPPQAAHFAS